MKIMARKLLITGIIILGSVLHGEASRNIEALLNDLCPKGTGAPIDQRAIAEAKGTLADLQPLLADKAHEEPVARALAKLGIVIECVENACQLATEQSKLFNKCKTDLTASICCFTKASSPSQISYMSEYLQKLSQLPLHESFLNDFRIQQTLSLACRNLGTFYSKAHNMLDFKSGEWSIEEIASAKAFVDVARRATSPFTEVNVEKLFRLLFPLGQSDPVLGERIDLLFHLFNSLADLYHDVTTERINLAARVYLILEEFANVQIWTNIVEGDAP
jgi:hypothetical protein